MTPSTAPPSQAEQPEQTGGWVPTRALGRAVLLTGLLLIAGVLLGRVDLVVLAAPFAIGTAYALRRRPAAVPQVRIATAEGNLVEGGELAGRITVGNPDSVDYDLAVVRSRTSPWLRVDRVTIAGVAVAAAAPEAGRSIADRPLVTAVPAGEVVDVDLSGTARRWGRHSLGPAGTQASAALGLLVSPPVVTEAIQVSTYPVTDPFDAVEAMPRAAGLVGAHHSRRPGEGGELAGVRVFAPGDRLRRSHCGRGNCTSRQPSPTGTPRWWCCSTCSRRQVAPVGSAVPRRCWIRRFGLPRRSRSTTCTAATGCRWWSTVRPVAGCVPPPAAASS